MRRTISAFLLTNFLLQAVSPLSCFSAPTPPKVPQQTTTFSVTPTFGAYLFSKPGSAGVTPLYGAKAAMDLDGKGLEDSLGIEASLDLFNSRAETGYLYRLDALYPFFQSKKAIPFFALGAGGVTTTGKGASDNSPLVNYGFGVKYLLENYLALRLDARHLLVYNDISTRSNVELSAGLTYFFGKERKKKGPAPETKPVEVVKKKEEPKEVKPLQPVPLDYGLLSNLGSSELFLRDLASAEAQVSVPLERAASASEMVMLAELPKSEEMGMEITLDEEIARDQALRAAEVAGASQTAADEAAARAARVDDIRTQVLAAAQAEAAGMAALASGAAALLTTAQPPPPKLLTVPQTAPPKALAKKTVPATPAPVALTPVTVAASSGAPAVAVLAAGLKKPEPPLPGKGAMALATPFQQPVGAAAGEERVVITAAVARPGAASGPVPEPVTLEFAFNSFKVRERYIAPLKVLAQFMAASPESTMTVEGHTDRVGRLDYNLTLSRLRAESVRYALAKMGVEKERISANGFGRTKPVAENSTSKGRQRNRRAVARVDQSEPADEP